MAAPCDIVDAAALEYLNGAQDLEKFGKALKKALGKEVPPDVLKAAFGKAADRYEADSKQLNDIKRELAQTVSGARRVSLQEKLATAFKAGLISSGRLLARNVLSHTTLAIAEEVSRFPAALWDIARAAVTNTDRARLAPDIASIGRSLDPTGPRVREIVRHVKEIVRTGHVENDPFAKDGALESLGITRETVYKNPLLNIAINGVFRLHAATDRPFRLYAFGRSIDEQATLLAKAERRADPGVDVAKRAAELRASPTDAMTLQAVIDGQSAVFAGHNFISDQAANVRRAAYAKSPTLGAAVDVSVPFTRVPVNVVLRSLEYQGGAVAAPLRAALARNLTPEQNRSIAQMFGRGVSGAALMAYGYILADKGLLTGADLGKSDNQKRKSRGQQPASLYLGGRYYALKAGFPVTAPLLMGATLREQSGREPALAAAVKSGMEEAANLPMTHLGGDIKDFAEDPARNIPNAIGRQASGVVPAVVGDIAAQMDRSGRKRSAQGLTAPTIAKIPGARNSLPFNPKDRRPTPTLPLIDPTLSAPGKAPHPGIPAASLARFLAGRKSH